jgi:hypothetical protein
MMKTIALTIQVNTVTSVSLNNRTISSFRLGSLAPRIQTSWLRLEARVERTQASGSRTSLQRIEITMVLQLSSLAVSKEGVGEDVVESLLLLLAAVVVNSRTPGMFKAHCYKRENSYYKPEMIFV